LTTVSRLSERMARDMSFAGSSLELGTVRCIHSKARSAATTFRITSEARPESPGRASKDDRAKATAVKSSGRPGGDCLLTLGSPGFGASRASCGTFVVSNRRGHTPDSAVRDQTPQSADNGRRASNPAPDGPNRPGSTGPPRVPIVCRCAVHLLLMSVDTRASIRVGSDQAQWLIC
jgi:hypothetical protein